MEVGNCARRCVVVLGKRLEAVGYIQATPGQRLASQGRHRVAVEDQKALQLLHRQIWILSEQQSRGSGHVWVAIEVPLKNE